MNKFTKFTKWFSDSAFISVHAFALYFTLYMTGNAFYWSGVFAMDALEKGTAGAEIALIIGAVTAPISYLQKRVLEIYSEYRRARNG